MTLGDFIGEHRNELISRCRAKVAGRSAQLLHGRSKTHEISKSATKQGHDLLAQQFTISQVVHGYGDVCQSVTDLAVELALPISTRDFRTLNRCLDDAIAGAVTEYAREQDLTRDGESSRLRNLADTALVDRQHAEIAPRVTHSKP